MYLVLQFEALVLYLEEEIVFAEDVAEEGGGFFGFVVLPFREPLGHFAFQAAGERDQSLGMLSEIIFRDARLVIKAMQRRFAGDLDEVAVSLVGLGEHQQVVVG